MASMSHDARMPLLLLHGSADSPRCWSGVITALGPGPRATAPPLPPAPAAGGSAIAQDLSWLHAQVLGLGGAVDLVGHSYGALLGLRYALQRPERVRHLGLCEPIAFHLLQGHPLRLEIDALNAAFFGHIAAGRSEAALAGLVDYWNGPGAFLGLSAAARSRLGRELPRTASEVAAGRDDQTAVADLAGLGMPCAVLAGVGTTAASRAVCEVLAEAVGTSVQIVRGAGHQAPRTHPQAVADAIGSLLTR